MDEFRLRDLRFGRQAGATCSALACAWSGLLIWDLMTPGPVPLGGVPIWAASIPLVLSITVWLLLWKRSGWLGHVRWLVAATMSLGLALISLATFVWGGFLILPVALFLGFACLFMCPIRDGWGREPTTTDLALPDLPASPNRRSGIPLSSVRGFGPKGDRD